MKRIQPDSPYKESNVAVKSKKKNTTQLLNIIVQTSDPFKSSPVTNNAVQYQAIFPNRERTLIGL